MQAGQLKEFTNVIDQGASGGEGWIHLCELFHFLTTPDSNAWRNLLLFYSYISSIGYNDFNMFNVQGTLIFLYQIAAEAESIWVKVVL